MVKKSMYQKIQELKRKGFNVSQISIQLKLNRRTVRKYFKMEGSDFRDYQNKHLYRDKKLKPYEEDILEIYRENGFRKLNMASVFDYLEEMHTELPCSEKSLRNYINYLIKTQKLKLQEHLRVYTKVPELPFGKQMQLDFGQYKTDSGLKVYMFACLLSSSRFKYMAFQDKPFKTKDVIQHLLDAFDYCGGMPKELVIDQDALLVVSENKGDIIYTKDFKCFIDEMELDMYVCRKADPESKGKIENFIKYAKYNFFGTRDFTDLQGANVSLQGWLERRVNGKISVATKRIPAELIIEERKHLRSIRNSIFRKQQVRQREDRIVNDKSMICVQSCQYSVPQSYKNQAVEIYLTQTSLFVYDIHCGKEIAKHDLSPIQGQRIIIREHFRHTHKSSGILHNEVESLYDFEEWRNFVSLNRDKFARYTRDQNIEALKYFKKDINVTVLKDSLEYCLKYQTYSFANLKDTYLHFLNDVNCDSRKVQVSLLHEKSVHPGVDVSTRGISFYKSLVKNRSAL